MCRRNLPFGGRSGRGFRKKIIRLRGQAKEDLGLAAELLLAALGRGEFSTQAEEERAVAGGTLLAEGLRDLRVLRDAHTKRD